MHTCHLEEDGEPRERGGARLADGACEASGGEVRRCSSAPAAAATFFPTAGRPRFIVSDLILQDVIC